MSTLDQIREGFGHALDTLSRGWQQLRERAGSALTRFHPSSAEGPVESVEAGVARNAARWGVLASEVRETDDALIIGLEIPGMESKDFEIQVVDDHLVVSGEKHLEREQARGRFYVMERAYGRFERMVPLPVPVDPQGARAKYHNGVLTVTLPKNLRALGRRIPVQGA
ncbi:heat shock protein Hsp20 [Thioalkalivibrio sulfidiphilus HL-EbGr7]|uniref:Heat shock protein Hsp20 n=1 Tax=Thioalkalivibrio sulfidiphilus (strain HL-EbGR7) TaxID=396588 RepID=B8GSY7_THISH|nr:Hsp20/alpha crystallin family protein [Thioalkalivibrio sulfidiphilus]ACL73002.1 heat shock protein Hsp20 [Thioalkalivibrio sulfidiphilus HL-EbGr7]